MDYYQKLNLKHVINASGKMTILGVSKITSKGLAAQEFGDNNFFEMADLDKKSGQYIAKLIGAEDAIIVNSASAGIVQSVAALIGQGSIYLGSYQIAIQLKLINFVPQKSIYAGWIHTFNMREFVHLLIILSFYVQ